MSTVLNKRTGSLNDSVSMNQLVCAHFYKLAPQQTVSSVISMFLEWQQIAGCISGDNIMINMVKQNDVNIFTKLLNFLERYSKRNELPLDSYIKELISQRGDLGESLMYWVIKGRKYNFFDVLRKYLSNDVWGMLIKMSPRGGSETVIGLARETKEVGLCMKLIQQSILLNMDIYLELEKTDSRGRSFIEFLIEDLAENETKEKRREDILKWMDELTAERLVHLFSQTNNKGESGFVVCVRQKEREILYKLLEKIPEKERATYIKENNFFSHLSREGCYSLRTALLKKVPSEYRIECFIKKGESGPPIITNIPTGEGFVLLIKDLIELLPAQDLNTLSQIKAEGRGDLIDQVIQSDNKSLFNHLIDVEGVLESHSDKIINLFSQKGKYFYLEKMVQKIISSKEENVAIANIKKWAVKVNTLDLNTKENMNQLRGTIHSFWDRLSETNLFHLWIELKNQGAEYWFEEFWTKERLLGFSSIVFLIMEHNKEDIKVLFDVVEKQSEGERAILLLSLMKKEKEGVSFYAKWHQQLGVFLEQICLSLNVDEVSLCAEWLRTEENKEFLEWVFKSQQNTDILRILLQEGIISGRTSFVQGVRKQAKKILKEGKVWQDWLEKPNELGKSINDYVWEKGKKIVCQVFWSDYIKGKESHVYLEKSFYLALRAHNFLAISFIAKQAVKEEKTLSDLDPKGKGLNAFIQSQVQVEQFIQLFSLFKKEEYSRFLELRLEQEQTVFDVIGNFLGRESQIFFDKYFSQEELKTLFQKISREGTCSLIRAVRSKKKEWINVLVQIDGGVQSVVNHFCSWQLVGHYAEAQIFLESVDCSEEARKILFENEGEYYEKEVLRVYRDREGEDRVWGDEIPEKSDITKWNKNGETYLFWSIRNKEIEPIKKIRRVLTGKEYENELFKKRSDIYPAEWVSFVSKKEISAFEEILRSKNKELIQVALDAIKEEKIVKWVLDSHKGCSLFEKLIIEEEVEAIEFLFQKEKLISIIDIQELYYQGKIKMIQQILNYANLQDQIEQKEVSNLVNLLTTKEKGARVQINQEVLFGIKEHIDALSPRISDVIYVQIYPSENKQESVFVQPLSSTKNESLLMQIDEILKNKKPEEALREVLELLEHFNEESVFIQIREKVDLVKKLTTMSRKYPHIVLSRLRSEKVLILLLKESSLEVYVNWFFRALKMSQTENALMIIDLIKHFVYEKKKWSKQSIINQFLSEKNKIEDKNIYVYALEKENVVLFRYLMSFVEGVEEKLFEDVFKPIFIFKNREWIETVMRGVEVNSLKKILKVSFQYGVQGNVNLIHLFFMKERLDLIKLSFEKFRNEERVELLKQNTSLNMRPLDYAGVNGNIDLIRYVKKILDAKDFDDIIFHPEVSRRGKKFYFLEILHQAETQWKRDVITEILSDKKFFDRNRQRIKIHKESLGSYFDAFISGEIVGYIDSYLDSITLIEVLSSEMEEDYSVEYLFKKIQVIICSQSGLKTVENWPEILKWTDKTMTSLINVMISKNQVDLLGLIKQQMTNQEWKEILTFKRVEGERSVMTHICSKKDINLLETCLSGLTREDRMYLMFNNEFLKINQAQICPFLVLTSNEEMSVSELLRLDETQILSVLLKGMTVGNLFSVIVWSWRWSSIKKILDALPYESKYILIATRIKESEKEEPFFGQKVDLEKEKERLGYIPESFIRLFTKKFISNELLKEMSSFKLGNEGKWEKNEERQEGLIQSGDWPEYVKFTLKHFSGTPTVRNTNILIRLAEESRWKDVWTLIQLFDKEKEEYPRFYEKLLLDLKGGSKLMSFFYYCLEYDWEGKAKSLSKVQRSSFNKVMSYLKACFPDLVEVWTEKQERKQTKLTKKEEHSGQSEEGVKMDKKVNIGSDPVENNLSLSTEQVKEKKKRVRKKKKHTSKTEEIESLNETQLGSVLEPIIHCLETVNDFEMLRSA